MYEIVDCFKQSTCRRCTLLNPAIWITNAHCQHMPTQRLPGSFFNLSVYESENRTDWTTQLPEIQVQTTMLSQCHNAKPIFIDWRPTVGPTVGLPLCDHRRKCGKKIERFLIWKKFDLKFKSYSSLRQWFIIFDRRRSLVCESDLCNCFMIFMLALRLPINGAVALRREHVDLSLNNNHWIGQCVQWTCSLLSIVDILEYIRLRIHSTWNALGLIDIS